MSDLFLRRQDRIIYIFKTKKKEKTVKPYVINN